MPIRKASHRHISARRMKGTEWPKYWKKKPPNGGATKLPKEIKARAIPSALKLSGRARNFS